MYNSFIFLCFVECTSLYNPVIKTNLVDDCVVGRVDSTLRTRQSSTLNNIIKCSINTVVSPYDGPTVARNMYRLIIFFK